MKIIEVEVCTDHVNMLVEIPLKISNIEFYGLSEKKK